jgi:uncharacterized membrane protein YgcG
VAGVIDRAAVRYVFCSLFGVVKKQWLILVFTRRCKRKKRSGAAVPHKPAHDQMPRPAAPGEPVGSHAGAAALVGRLSAGCAAAATGGAGADPATALAAAHALAVRLDAVLARHGLTKAGLALDLAGDLFVAVALPGTAATKAPECVAPANSAPGCSDEPGAGLYSPSSSSSSACAPPPPPQQQRGDNGAPSTSGGAGASGRGGAERAGGGAHGGASRREGGDGATPPAAGEPARAALLAALRAATAVHASLGQVRGCVRGQARVGGGVNAAAAGPSNAERPIDATPAATTRPHSLAAHPLSKKKNLSPPQVSLPTGARAVVQLGVATGSVVDGLIGCGNTLDYRCVVFWTN